MAGTRDPVVVGVDGSADADGALRWAADEAYRRQRPLRVVHAAASEDPDAHREAGRLVEDAAAEARAWQPGIEVSAFVYAGTPAVELCTESAHADLVVVGSHGRGGIAGLLLGSVSAQLAVHARCPVLVVRNAQRWAGPETALPTRQPVVVGVDGSPAADLAVGVAFEEAAARGVAVTAVHVGAAGSIESVGPWRGKYPQVPVETRRVPGNPGAVLVRASRDALLAVVGTGAHGPFAGLLHGSVSQQLLHHAECPVLVVPGPGGPGTA